MWLLMALVGVISAVIHLPIELEPLSIVRISETDDQVVGAKGEPVVVATAAGEDEAVPYLINEELHRMILLSSHINARYRRLVVRHPAAAQKATTETPK